MHRSGCGEGKVTSTTMEEQGKAFPAGARVTSQGAVPAGAQGWRPGTRTCLHVVVVVTRACLPS